MRFTLFCWALNTKLNCIIGKIYKEYFCHFCRIWSILPEKCDRLKQWTVHHHHHVVRPARISLTLSRHISLSFIASGRSSGLHPVSSHSCCMYVRAGRPAFDWPYAGVYRSTSPTRVNESTLDPVRL